MMTIIILMMTMIKMTMVMTIMAMMTAEKFDCCGQV